MTGVKLKLARGWRITARVAGDRIGGVELANGSAVTDHQRQRPAASVSYGPQCGLSFARVAVTNAANGFRGVMEKDDQLIEALRLHHLMLGDEIGEGKSCIDRDARLFYVDGKLTLLRHIASFSIKRVEPASTKGICRGRPQRPRHDGPIASFMGNGPPYTRLCAAR